MYLELKKHLFVFENCLDAEPLYLNMFNYSICNKEEYQNYLEQELFAKNDFIEIARKDRHEIVVDYLRQLNERRLIRRKDEEDFFSLFHFYIEGNRLVDDWQKFEKEQLLLFAAKWCDSNNISYTKK